jgi:hypothetical protein
MNTSGDTSLQVQLPCLTAGGAKIFTRTAGQRALSGDEEFLRTHFPIQLLSYRSGSQAIWTEHDLLQQLLARESVGAGNRVYILYGAAGSGKSELLRWLHIHIQRQDSARAAVTTRITRTDLDIFHIVQRLQETYGLPPLREASLRRWEACRQKPRTLAKIIVLSALEQLLTSDEQINALYYQLIDIVQRNLERCFASMSQPAEDIGQYIELLSREDLQEMVRTSVVPLSLEYETLRFYLLRVLREQLLEGFEFSSTLQQIAHTVHRERGQRPLLLIDDLVQSIQLFASDILDYVITLEHGCWDVVIGITPHSLESTLRGKELLDRITYLDTIDDRVQKLWLSDEHGLSSSFLHEGNCAEYARRYLSEYKRHNRQRCDATCPAFERCQHLEPERSEHLLAPFNKEVLIRLFRSLPAGKGRARYFTLYLREILLRIARGEDLLNVLQEYIKTEWAVYSSDQLASRIYELYSSFLHEGTTSVLDPEAHEHLHQFFGRQPAHRHLPVVASLHKQSAESRMADARPDLDPGKEAIKAWLQGEVVNKQLLKTLRRGILKAIKEAYALDMLTRLHTARPQRVLRWAQTRLDTVPPVALEGIDDFAGLAIARTTGPLAYILHDFAGAGGWSEIELRTALLSHEAFPGLLFASSAYRSSVQHELERQLDMEIDTFAWALFLLALCFHRFPLELPAALQSQLATHLPSMLAYPGGLETLRPRLTNQQVSAIRRLFDDCFKLRENVYDGRRLAQIAARLPIHHAIALIQAIDASHIESDYRFNEEPLGVCVAAIQEAVFPPLAQLRSNPTVKAWLCAACQTASGAQGSWQAFASLVGLPGRSEACIDLFVQRCTPLDLHQALCLAYQCERAQHEHLLVQIHSYQESAALSPQARTFSAEELKILISLVQQDLTIPLSQIELSLLTSIAQRLPGLYYRLELRFQRG